MVQFEEVEDGPGKVADEEDEHDDEQYSETLLECSVSCRVLLHI